MFKYLILLLSRSLEFSKSEARGTLGLIFIILIAIFLTRLYISHLKKEKVDIDPTERAALEQWAQEVTASIRIKKEKAVSAERPTSNDPLPTPPKVTAGKEEFTSESTDEKVIMDPPAKVEKSDLNLATMEALQEVYGIGPSFSKRIVNYRKLLGGFSSLDQLREVYGLKKETIIELEKVYTIRSAPTPIPLNTDSVKVLAKHPYVSYDLAWAIFNYRQQHGDIHSPEDLRKIKAVNADVLERLKPYLKK